MSDDTLVAALARAQAKFGTIGKGHTNSHFGSKYGDIADVLDVVRPALAAEGIAVCQPVRITDDGCELVTALLKGEERMESAFPMPTGMKPQDTLSWMTYMRRGLLCSMVGVHPAGEDDDGNAAQASDQSENRWQGGTRFPDRGGKAASPKQVKFASELLEKVVHVNLVAQYIEDTIGRPSPLEELSTAEMSKLIDKLQDDRKAGVTPEAAYPADEEPFA